ncbi:cobalamin synthesis protein P47K [Paenibacillus curdlanolyticus YK9]|uniref:Cobalamin synthesis protein P47K n=1 Tax=Paenibacillus curdlanolyticus YK9 TaxID=717606 RepID=E0I737_9BACL|nr:GTP-binding protein [Paenibacillus curdlanolyticus]EFM11853.1 cobalamin synthesis protein P47K [Paenibacillus curdlanolyticus YK9]
MANTTNKPTVDVHVLTGFLGSGKTTLLKRLLDEYEAQGKKAAVVMNELGDVNLDGLEVESEVPMAEMLGGCICCSIRGDLSMELKLLIDEHQPDVVLIEATGAANPFEMIDGVTETAMYTPVELKSIIVVVDGPELLARSRSGGQTFKLMKEQIRSGTRLLLNKADRLAGEQLVEAEQLIREINGYAPILATVRCAVDSEWLGGIVAFGEAIELHGNGNEKEHSHAKEHVCGPACDHDHHHDHAHHAHHSHEHVMALTHYLSQPVDSHQFEAFLKSLPDNVYRAKGVVTFRDSETASRFLFQYAYKETDFMRITPQGKVHDVAVFIGEHFSREHLLQELAQLETNE